MQKSIALSKAKYLRNLKEISDKLGITGIDKNNFSIYAKNSMHKRRSRDYQGCVSIRYGDVKILDEIF